MILVLAVTVTIEVAASMLWRREKRSVNRNKSFKRPQEPTVNSVLVEQVLNFEGVDAVLYTKIGCNIGVNTPFVLANLAIQSALDVVGEAKLDGVRYLYDNIQNGVVTKLTEAYEEEVLRQTQTKSLLAAIEKLDALRPEV